MLSEELALGLVLRVLRLNLLNTDNSANAGAQLGWERWVCDKVFVGALWVGGDEADSLGWGGVDWVWEGDLSWLQAAGIDNVLLGGESEPDWGLGGLVLVVADEGLLGLLGGGGFVIVADVLEECLGGLQGLYLNVSIGTLYILSQKLAPVDWNGLTHLLGVKLIWRSRCDLGGQSGGFWSHFEM